MGDIEEDIAVKVKTMDEPEQQPSDEKENTVKPPFRTAVVATVLDIPMEETDPETTAQLEIIKNTQPTTSLEIAMSETLKRKENHVARLTNEITKLKSFISKRKQTYKRKRKDEGAPTRALSAYNIFVQERFAKLAKENEIALRSDNAGAKLKRVPPANLVATTGNEWKALSAEEKVKYEEEAKGDRERYEKQMAVYQPPDKQANRKRNKTGYNMFFSAHVLRLKNSESGVPSERGSVARLVGTAWKQLSDDEKQYYEREADKHNGLNPIREGEEEVDPEEDEARKQAAMEHHYMHPADIHMGMPPPMHGGMHPPPHHDPRAAQHYGHYPPHMYGQPAYHYDYSQHHQRHSQSRSSSQQQQQQQQQGYIQNYGPPPRHPYDTMP